MSLDASSYESKSDTEQDQSKDQGKQTLIKPAESNTQAIKKLGAGGISKEKADLKVDVPQEDSSLG